MADPISGAIAGAVTSKSIEKIVEYIDKSEDPEEAWKRSALEITIQVEAFYRQEIVAGRLYDTDQIQRKFNSYGEVAQQLAIRGEVRGYDEDFTETIREFGDSCAEYGELPRGMGSDPEEEWEEIVEPTLSEIKDEVDVS